MATAFRKLNQRSYTLVHMEHVASILQISPHDILQWTMTVSEYAMHLLRTQDGLYLDVAGITQIIRRRCEPKQISWWLRHIQPHNRALTEAEKKFVASRQGYKCNVCNDLLTNTYEIDHVEMQSVRRSDTHAQFNLQALCPKCHRTKTWQDNIYGNPVMQAIPWDVDDKDNIFAQYHYIPT